MGALDDRLQAVLDDFELLDGWNARYEYLIALGGELPPLPAALRTEATAVQGCLSPVWLTGSVDSAGGLTLQGDSEGVLPKGLVGLCVRLYSGVPAAEILAWNRALAAELGLNDNLSPTRSAAFANLLARVRELAQNLKPAQFKKAKTSGGYDDRFGGLGRIYGDGSLDRLKAARITVVGIGGVGTWAAEALARSGIGHLHLIDRDDVCVTNTNRQVHALDGQYGRMKVDAMADRLRQINPEIKVTTTTAFLTAANTAELLTPAPEVVIDAMDSVPDKAALVKYCLDNKIPLLISGGAGGKTDPTQIRTADLNQAFGDPLLKALRRRLKQEFGLDPGQKGSFGLLAVHSLQPAVMPWEVCAAVQAPSGGNKIGCETGFGSVSFVTGAFGFALASAALNLVTGKFDTHRALS